MEVDRCPPPVDAVSAPPRVSSQRPALCPRANIVIFARMTPERPHRYQLHLPARQPRERIRANTTLSARSGVSSHLPSPRSSRATTFMRPCSSPACRTPHVASRATQMRRREYDAWEERGRVREFDSEWGWGAWGGGGGVERRADERARMEGWDGPEERISL
ncbi:hypothetical protein B0H17DRAFT_1194098 [Mycena rosella]|uniref:Uncharacterized protein n=1 Tax=Mycena rosella TaxID=1033263 RepID=A0AAD7E168_MYCRO|nr:hypothetical protein B0H17DRAFT_1194098 [Mycena rosella]